MNRDWLFSGHVHHRRPGLAANAFRYPALFICFPLSQLESLGSTLFGLNRFRLFAFYDADHGTGGRPEPWVRSILCQHGVWQADGEIWLMTMPRMLGFVFNPVSFWFCHGAGGELRAVVCEVNNTFGDRHVYLVTAPDGAAIGNDRELPCHKVFHVSPFFPVRGEYRFRFSREADRVAVQIDYYLDGELALATGIAGRGTALTDRHLLGSFLLAGWATAMVVVRIHWQALRLWLKGASVHSRPEPPREEISS